MKQKNIKPIDYCRRFSTEKNAELYRHIVNERSLLDRFLFSMNFANKVTGLTPRCYICSSDNVSFFTDFFRGGRIYKCDTCKNAITVRNLM